MSAEYKGQDPLEIAKQAEADLNSHAAKHGHDANISSGHGKGASDSSVSPSPLPSPPFPLPPLSHHVAIKALGAFCQWTTRLLHPK